MSFQPDELLERMSTFPSRLSRLLGNYSPERLRRAAPGGGWGAVEHLAHLRDFDQVTLDRVEQILGGESPEIEVFDTDVRAIELDYHAQDPAKMLAEFSRLREELIDRLRALPPEAWERTARHAILGEITLRELIQRLDEHSQLHFQTLKDEVL